MRREGTSNFRESQQYKKDKNFESKANKIIRDCIQQNQIFRERQAKQNWRAIHQAHYDWWAFPIDQRSSYGQEYMVTENQVKIMKENPQFIAALKSNAIIVCKAWGWDLIKGQSIPTDHKDQRWHNWPIRLYKMARSLEIFQLKPYFQHAVKYGLKIMESGKHLSYGHRDISAYFTQKWTQIKNSSTEDKFFNQKPSQIQKSQTNTKRTQSLMPKGMSEAKKPIQKQNKMPQPILKQQRQRTVQCQLFRNFAARF